jgi:hypothetical protein
MAAQTRDQGVDDAPLARQPVVAEGIDLRVEAGAVQAQRQRAREQLGGPRQRAWMAQQRQQRQQGQGGQHAPGFLSRAPAQVAGEAVATQQHAVEIEDDGLGFVHGIRRVRPQPSRGAGAREGRCAGNRVCVFSVCRAPRWSCRRP